MMSRSLAVVLATTVKLRSVETLLFLAISALWALVGQRYFLRLGINGAADVWCLLVSAEQLRLRTSPSPPVCSCLTSCSSSPR